MSISPCCGAIPHYVSDRLLESYVHQTAFFSKQTQSNRLLAGDLQVQPATTKVCISWENKQRQICCVEGKNTSQACAVVTQVCRTHMDQIENFLQQFHRSFGEAGHQMFACIHDPHVFNNLYWDPAQKKVFFGEVDTKHFKSFCSNFDLTAHEFLHGMLQNHAKLPYFGQSGALNESIADVYTIMIKHFQQQCNATDPDASWTIGDGIFNSDGVSLRSLSNPGSAFKKHPLLGDDPQVDHMRSYYNTSQDHGGVHLNSGIPSRAFYLAATKIGGKVWERTGRIWDRAMSETNRDTFATFAYRTIECAQILYPNTADLIREAWKEVGIEPQMEPPIEMEEQDIKQSAFHKKTSSDQSSWVIPSIGLTAVAVIVIAVWKQWN